VYTIFLVTEMKYEKILPQIDGANFDASKEFRFNVPAQSEYFTR